VSRQPAGTQIRDQRDGWSADRIMAIGLGLAVLAALAQIVTQVISFAVYDDRIGALNSDVHASIFGIVSIVAMGAAAAATAVRAREAANPRPWWLLTGILTVLLAVRAALPDDPAALSAPLAIVFVGFWVLTARDPARPRTMLRVALFLLVFSFVIHVVGLKIVTELGYGYNTWPYEIKGMLKHSTEIAGWVLIATGLLAASGLARPTRVLRNPRS
jgi:hypothetical protein